MSPLEDCIVRNAIRNGRLLILVGCAAAIVSGAGAMRADLMVSRGFDKVLGTQAALSPFEVTETSGPKQPAQVGDEGYWLTRAEVESPVPFAKRLARGDRITISGRDGRERNLEVIDLKAIGEPLTKVATGTGQMRLLLVTCRIVDGTERETQASVRFIIEGEAQAVTPAVQPSVAPKTL